MTFNPLPPCGGGPGWESARQQGCSFTRETQLVLWLIAASTLIRLGFAWALGLGVDESYTVAAGRSLRLGYFDHPPASWWMQWGAAHLLGTEAPLAVRLPFILTFALSTWLMYRLGTALAGEGAGLWAAVALNLAPVFGVTSASWVLPDGPLDCALLGAALCLLHALSARGTAGFAWWVGAGVCAGVALFSKYTAVLTLGGAVLYLLTSRTHRRWLARPEPYVAGICAVLVFAPVVIWNAMHDWVSFAFQGERAGGLRFRPGQPFIVLAGEALFILPWIWLPVMAEFVAALRRGPAVWRSWLPVCLGAPPIVVFALIAAWSSQRVLFHWAAPGYLMLFPLLGAFIAQRIGARWLRATLIGTAALVVAAVAIVSIQIRLDWLHPVIGAIAKHDPDLEGIDWTSLRTQLASRRTAGIGHDRRRPRLARRREDRLRAWTGYNCDGARSGRTAIRPGPSGARLCGANVLVLVVNHPEQALRDLAPMFDAVESCRRRRSTIAAWFCNRSRCFWASGYAPQRSQTA